ncbi:MAG: hypothetical protein AAB580_00190 [Patescibacteria group bacterium]
MNKKNILILLLFSLVMLVSFRISQTRSLSMHFVDEEDHMTIAGLTNRGLKLYEDIQSNHQPIVYFSSAKLQQLLDPPNIFMLVRRHRQAMFAYGLIWSAIILWRFKAIGLIFIIFFEWLKYYLFGNLWLMESFAVYPAVYLFGAMLQNWFDKIKIKTAELIWLSFCSFGIIFSLVPLWPWLALTWLVLWIRIKKKILAAGLTLIILTGLFFIVTGYSPVNWFIRVIYNNFVYAVPDLSPFHGPLDYLKMIFFPFLAYFAPGALQAQFIALFFTGYLVSCWFKPKLLLIYPFLLLANNRVLSPSAVYYQGFHLLPWLGLMIFTFAFSLKFLPKYFILGFSLWGLVLFANRAMPYFWQTDPNYEYYVNYSMFDDLNFSLKTIGQKDKGMRAAVLTNEVLVQWQTPTVPATKQVVYYPWERKIAELKEDYKRTFTIDNPNPPEFIYGSMEQELVKIKYQALYRNGKATELFIRKDIYANITPEQWEILAFRGFSRE